MAQYGGLLGNPQALPAQGPGGLLGGFGNFFQDLRTNNPEVLMAVGQGLMSGDMAGGFAQAQQAVAAKRQLQQQQQFQREGWGRQDARWQQEQAMQQQALAREQQQLQAERTRTQQWAHSTNDPEVIALADAGMGAEAVRYWMSKGKPLGGADLPASVREFQFSQENPEFGDYMREKRSGSGMEMTMPDGTRVSIGGKVPAGFQPDPRNPGALMPIPGGPGEQISGELAARIGLADRFMSDVAPGLRESLAQGAATGPLDRFQAANIQSSTQAKVYRDLELGTEALQRMMTGAGMPESEAKNYARRFLPTYTDDAASAVAKLDQLTNALAGAREMAMRGRGGAPTAQPPGSGQWEMIDGVRIRRTN